MSCFADFYGTWCVGCAKVYPEVCRVAADPVLRQKCHFVKVNEVFASLTLAAIHTTAIWLCQLADAESAMLPFSDLRGQFEGPHES